MAASQYSNVRAQARRDNPGANTTQRSWSNYAGDRPIKSKIGSSFYEDSELYGPGGGGGSGSEGGAAAPASAVSGLQSPAERTQDFREKWGGIQSEETEFEKLNPNKSALGRAKKAIESGYVGPIA